MRRRATTAGAHPLRRSKSRADFPRGLTLYPDDERHREGHDVEVVRKRRRGAGGARGQAADEGSAIIVVTSTGDAVQGYSTMQSKPGWGADLPELLRNDDWNYGVFGADKRARTDVDPSVCLAWHKLAAKKSYLFTLDDLAKPAPAKP